MYAELSHLGRSYFHQDYYLESDTPIGIVVDYRQAVSPERVAALRAELDSVLDSDLDDDALTKIWLEDSAASYDPRHDHLSVRDWLHAVAEVLAAPSSPDTGADTGAASPSPPPPGIPRKGSGS